MIHAVYIQLCMYIQVHTYSGVARLVSLGGHLTVLLEYYNLMTVLLEYIDLHFTTWTGTCPPRLTLATPLHTYIRTYVHTVYIAIHSIMYT